MINLLTKPIILSCLLTITVSCGKKQTNSGNVEQLSQMKFFDSTVSGLKYKTQSNITSLTNSSGVLHCIEGELVKFLLSNIELAGEVICTHGKTILPTDLLNPATTNSDSQETIAIGLLLQSLDVDSSPANGIQLDHSIHNFEYSTILDLSDSTDLDSNDKSDNLEALLTEINSLSGATIQDVTETSARDHMRISFGSNTGDDGITMSTTNTINLGSACPTSINIFIENDIIKTSISGGAEIDLNDFRENKAIRNLSNNSYYMELETNDLSYDIGLCGGSTFMKATLAITGSASFTTAGNLPTITGSYSYKITCLDSSTINICTGSY